MIFFWYLDRKIYIFPDIVDNVGDLCLSTFSTRVGCPSDSLSLTLTSAVVGSITNRFFGSVHKDEKIHKITLEQKAAIRQ